MENITISINDETFKKMADFYQDFIQENNNPNLLLFARLDDCTVSIYKTLKVVFQGENAGNEAKIWNYILPDNGWGIKYSHGGSDEVGTGDYYGPVCVAAVYVKKEDIGWLTSIGVKDSKKLDDDFICQVAPLLIKRLIYSQMAVDNQKFNEITASGYNMNKIKAILHNAVLTNLQKKVSVTVPLIVDQFAEENLYYSYLKDEPYVVKNINFMTKAESYSPAVAAASIIARYSFIRKMEELGKKYHTVIPKGAGPVADTFGELFVKLYGFEELHKIAKINFKNTDKIHDLLNRFKLDN